MIKYDGYEITEGEYYRQVFCNGEQRYRWKMSGRAEGKTIFHTWNEVGDTFRERCIKCGMSRFINKWVGI